MRYYHDFDFAYQNLQKRNLIGWGGVQNWDEFRRFPLRPFLDVHLADRGPGTRLLELGCGTGPAVFYGAERGWESWGFDISPTAIAMAQNLARERKLSAQFYQGDVLSLPETLPLFDVLIDGSCLHCLVFDEDRRRALSSWRERLAPRGVFILQTLIYDESICFKPSYLLDPSGILWYRTKQSCLAESRFIEGEFRVPQRRLLTAIQLRQELMQSGWGISAEMSLKRPGRPSHFYALCHSAI